MPLYQLCFNCPLSTPYTMSSSPTCDALASVLNALATRLGTLEDVMKDFGKSMPTVDIHAMSHNTPEGFHTSSTKGKGKGKAPQNKSMVPPPSSSSSKAKPANKQKPTMSATKHSPHSFHQAQTFSMEGNPNRLLIMVVIPAAAAGHVVGKGGKGLKQIHDISGAQVTTYKVATSPDECHLSLQGTNTQIGDALNVLGKRLTQKQVHYPKSKKTVPASSTTAPLPTSMARPVPSASSKSCMNLPPPPIVQTPSTSWIFEVPSNEPEDLSSEEEPPKGSPMPLYPHGLYHHYGSFHPHSIFGKLVSYGSGHHTGLC